MAGGGQLLAAAGANGFELLGRYAAGLPSVVSAAHHHTSSLLLALGLQGRADLAARAPQAVLPRHEGRCMALACDLGLLCINNVD